MNQNKGFTLIEVIISIAILSILLAIAVPKYKDYIREGNRAAMKAELMQIASALERYKALQMTYTNATLAAGPGSVYGSEVYPKGESGSKVLYDLSFSEAPGTTWELVAAPANVQEGDGVLMINSAGQTCWSETGGGSCAYGTDKAW